MSNNQRAVRNLAEDLEKEKQFLANEIDDLKERLGHYPTGTLQINHCRNHVQFYYREDKSASSRSGRPPAHYIKKKDIELARQLAQRDYEKQLLKQLEKRYHVIESAADVYSGTNLSNPYQKCTDDRKKLIIPRYMSDEDYAAQWQDVQFTRKPFAEGVPEIYSARGERVRSKSEKIIADTLDRYDIPYRYEYPLEFKGERTLYPDFNVLNRRTRQEYYLEHLGMMDDPEYAADAVRRIEYLGAHGIIPGKNLLITAETRNRPLNVKILNRFIHEYLI